MTGAIKATFLAAAVLGLGFGGYLGYTSANEVNNSLESVQYIDPTKITSDFARTQFLHADNDHARRAVMLQIQLLEQLEAVDKAFHADELGLAYIRLAMIEEAAGRPEAEQSALVQARARYKRGYSRSEESTDDELKNAVRRSDKAIDNR